MAEFSELVRIKKRICAKYKHNGNCKGCPVGEKFICGIISISDYDDMSFKVCEDTLLSWDAEHPEPVYPTWEQYLADLMTADMKADKTDNPNSVENYMCKTQIPADIAQKLGIEPKEG